MAKINKSLSVPENMKVIYESIIGLVEGFCTKHLNEEYAQLCRQAVASLSRKRPSPLARGGHEGWACGVLHALATVNFAFDKSTKPHITLNMLTDAFDIAKSTAQGKSKQIRDWLGMNYFDHTWTVPSRHDTSLIWYISVNGLIVDARTMPLEVQMQACSKGLIPYVPALKEIMEK